MASGPWDNVQLPGPPNGPAYIQAAGQMAGQIGNLINSGFGAYQRGQDFQYQQAQRNFFQDPANQAALQAALGNAPPQYKQYAPLIQALMQSGGAPAAQQLLPSLISQQQQGQFFQALNNPNGEQQPVSAGPDTSTHAASDKNIIPTPRVGYGEGTNLNEIAGKIGANVPDQVLQRIATSVGVSSPEDGLTPDQQGRAQVRLNQYLKRNGGNANPVAQSGNGDQEAASSNQLNPSTGQGSPAMTPRQGPDRRAAQAATVPSEGTFNDRFAPTGVTRAGAETVAGETRGTPIGTLADAQKADNLAKYYNRLAGAPGISPQQSAAAKALAEQYSDQAKEIRSQLGKYNEPTPAMKEAEASGAKSPLEYKSAEERAKLKATEYGKQFLGIQAMDRAAADSDEDMRAMRGILNDPKLFTMGGNELVTHLRGALINAGLMDPNARLPNEALKKVTSKALQAQMASMRDDAAQIGGSAGRVMLAQVRIMQDAAQNPDMSPSGLRYLTELMERANFRSHAIAQMARDYNRQNGGRGLDEGFDQRLADYSRKNPLMTNEEIEHHKLLSSPHLPEELQGAGASKIAQWAHGHGLKKGDPIRVPSNEPPGYEYRFSP